MDISDCYRIVTVDGIRYVVSEAVLVSILKGDTGYRLTTTSDIIIGVDGSIIKNRWGSVDTS